MYKFTFCSNLKDLGDFLDRANKYGYTIISVTEKHGFTIIYKI
ncbi:MAG: hypothetical protein ACLTDM_07160 [Clostridium butyricum]